jgi:hypothetical protein
MAQVAPAPRTLPLADRAFTRTCTKDPQFPPSAPVRMNSLMRGQLALWLSQTPIDEKGARGGLESCATLHWHMRRLRLKLLAFGRAAAAPRPASHGEKGGGRRGKTKKL